jgi:hypothetical protein
LLAAGGAALYYFWPTISAGFNATIATTPPPPPAPGAQVVPPATAAITMQSSQSVPVYTPTPSNLQGVAAADPTAAAIAQAALNNMLAQGGPQVTNSSPIGPWTPGATQLPGGCWTYGNTPVLANCPPGAAAPAGRAPARGRCLPGFTMDAAGICANTADQVMLAQLNSTPYTGPQSLPATPLNSTILGTYASTIGIQPGTVLAQMLGLPANPSNGTIEQGNDGFNYQTVNGTYIRQGTATQSTRATGPIGARPMPFPAGTRLKGLGAVAAALPITNATLIAASNDPTIAAMVGTDPRAMLTLPQWNYFYSQASGVLQVAPPWPEVDPNTLISAAQYQAWRKAAGLGVELQGKLGTIRRSRPGMFPLGGISDGPMRQPFVQPGNTNLYRIPGRGVVRLGVIQAGGGNHRWARSPFPRPADWRMAE